MFARIVSRFLKGRQRSQGLVEYGVIAASMAFVGVAGFNALSGAQKAYLTEFPKNGDVPAAPGALLHPVQLDPLACNPPTVTLNSPITCNVPNVYDNFNNPTDRNPPLGYLDFYLDGNIWISACALAAKTSTSSACGISTLSWTPTDAALATGTPHSIQVKYEMETSNHF